MAVLPPTNKIMEPTLESRLSNRVLVLDGAMGTMIMNASLSEADFRGEIFKNHPVALKGCNDIIVLTSPDVIADIHRQYLEAGADIISTDTFNANRLSLAEYGVDRLAADICRHGAMLARKAIDDYCRTHEIEEQQRPMVAGSMGPTSISLSFPGKESMRPTTDFSAMAAAYEEQASALIEGGADILLLETVFDLLNAKAALQGITDTFLKSGRKIPLIISATMTKNGKLPSGESLREFVETFEPAEPLAFGLNCGFGAEAMTPHLRELSSITRRFVSAHPNAGLPDKGGLYKDTPEKMLKEVKAILEEGIVNIIGGCCGTTPDHIRLIAREAKRHSPRQSLFGRSHKN